MIHAPIALRMMSSPTRALLLAGVLALAGCGGGTAENSNGATPPIGGSSGGGSGTSVQALANTPEQARSLVTASMSADGSVVAADKRFDKLDQNGLGTVTADGGAGAALALQKTGKSTSAAVAKATQTIDCNQIYQIGSQVGPNDTVTACSGTLTIDASDQAAGSGSTVLPAGAYFNFTFNNISVTTSASGVVQINGQMNLSVIEALTLTNGLLFGKIRASVVNLSGFSEGQFLPAESFTMDITYAGTSIGYTIDGQPFANLNIDYTDDDNFTIVSGDLQAPIEGGSVEIQFDDWAVVDGIPQTGATVTATGANGTSASLEVISTTANSATFEVTITADGTTQTRIVVATVINGQVIVQ